MKVVIIGSDHGGYKLKEQIKEYINSLGYGIEDIGCSSEESCDYPEFAKKAARKVIATGKYAILICGTGIGMSIAANRFQGIRAALCYDENTALLARKHNNANILCLGGRTTSLEKAKSITKIFLTTRFTNDERHIRRIKKIDSL